jgi:hypothetical protein
MSDQPRIPPQSETLSESEREALYAWAYKYGFTLRNAADEKLARKIWRKNLLDKSDDIVANAPCSACSDLLNIYRTNVSAYSKATDDLKGLIGNDLKLMFARAEEFRLACGHAHQAFMEHWRVDHRKLSRSRLA